MARAGPSVCLLASEGADPHRPTLHWQGMLVCTAGSPTAVAPVPQSSTRWYEVVVGDGRPSGCPVTQRTPLLPLLQPLLLLLLLPPAGWTGRPAAGLSLPSCMACGGGPEAVPAAPGEGVGPASASQCTSRKRPSSARGSAPPSGTTATCMSDRRGRGVVWRGVVWSGPWESGGRQARRPATHPPRMDAMQATAPVATAPVATAPVRGKGRTRQGGSRQGSWTA